MSITGTMPTYPQRPRFFAHRFVRVLHKSCAAQDIGPAACYLCCIIAHTEDAGRYAGPARFWRSQLMETLGFKSPKQLVISRNKAIEAGWLVYHQAGTRSVGEYFVTIPERFSKLPDSPIEAENDHGISSAGGTNNGTNQPIGDGGLVPQLVPLETYKRNANGSISGTQSGPLPIPSPNPLPGPIPNTSSCPASGDADEQPGNADAGKLAGKSSKAEGKKPVFTDDDMTTAEWFWQTIEAMQPGRKAPKLDQWANTFRLMRDRDGRTIEQIRALFDRVQRDSFWRVNVLSPDKLREKWDDLNLRLQENANGTGKHNGRRPAVDRAGAGVVHDPAVKVGDGFR